MNIAFVFRNLFLSLRLSMCRSFLSQSLFSGQLQPDVYSAGVNNFPFCVSAVLRVVTTWANGDGLPAPSISASDLNYLLADQQH